MPPFWFKYNYQPAPRGSGFQGYCFNCGWYGPGVSTFAAAIRFLQVLDQKLSKDIRPIPIVEGFLSYKKIRTQHADDAQRLLSEFFTAERFQARSNSEPIISEIDGIPSIVRYNHP
jgi:hypothetical protein